MPTGPRRSRGAVRCQLIAEPTTLSALHVARWCKACARANFGCKTRFWCGFYETALPGKPGAYSKSIDVGFENDLYFMLNKSFGVAHTWLRRWRYRMYLHRASFQGEAVLLRLLDGNVQKKARQQLAQAWVREILWRRARECDTDLHKDLAGKLLCWPLEKLIHSVWSWYEPHMFSRPVFLSRHCVCGPRTYTCRMLLLASGYKGRPSQARSAASTFRRPRGYRRHRRELQAAPADLWHALRRSGARASAWEEASPRLLGMPSPA